MACAMPPSFRHGLRVSELCTLIWDQIDFSHGRIHVRRLKNRIPSVHAQMTVATRTTIACSRI